VVKGRQTGFGFSAAFAFAFAFVTRRVHCFHMQKPRVKLSESEPCLDGVRSIVWNL
jgi:hypothetical protein